MVQRSDGLPLSASTTMPRRLAEREGVGVALAWPVEVAGHAVRVEADQRRLAAWCRDVVGDAAAPFGERQVQHQPGAALVGRRRWPDASMSAAERATDQSRTAPNTPVSRE